MRILSAPCSVWLEDLRFSWYFGHPWQCLRSVPSSGSCLDRQLWRHGGLIRSVNNDRFIHRLRQRNATIFAFCRSNGFYTVTRLPNWCSSLVASSRISAPTGWLTGATSALLDLKRQLSGLAISLKIGKGKYPVVRIFARPVCVRLWRWTALAN